MTVVAWDGRYIAADKQSTCAGLKTTVTKLRRLLPSKEVLACTGDFDSALMMMDWYEHGAKPSEWPACQADKEAWTRLIVATAAGVKVYERQPVAMHVHEKYMAWGSGRDYAIGAMAFGADAEHAISIACHFDAGCGMGFDIMDLRTDAAHEPQEKK